jgi:hypothetical protein
VLITPNVRVFDFVRGETATITSITGGNPNLLSDSRHVFKVGAFLRPINSLDLRFRADYVSSTTRGDSSSFPAVTAAVEAAFPDRFVRDADGRLLSVDYRPVNVASIEREELSWGINLSLPIKSAMQRRMEERRAQRERERAEAERNGTPLPPEGPPRARGQGQGQGAGQGPGQGQPQRGGFFGGGGPGQGGRGPGGGGFGGGGLGGGGFGGGGQGQGRFLFNFTHIWLFKDRTLIRAGMPVLDRLNGAPVGNRGGSPEHVLQAEVGVAKDGLRAEINGRWQSGTRVVGGTLTSVSELNYDSFGTVNLEFNVNLGEWRGLGRRNPWLRGAQLRLDILNLFDAERNVTDQTGATPLSLQPDLIDPTSRRMVRLRLRKLFF